MLDYKTQGYIPHISQLLWQFVARQNMRDQGGQNPRHNKTGVGYIQEGNRQSKVTRAMTKSIRTPHHAGSDCMHPERPGWGSPEVKMRVYNRSDSHT